jgi:two-component system sensor histidine kinase BaeS
MPSSSPSPAAASPSARYVATAVYLGVSDTGPGIRHTDLPYVFDKYRRVSSTSQIEGAGLGLYIVRHLVEAHGGSVSVNSIVGQGSTFVMRLPVVEAQQV